MNNNCLGQKIAVLNVPEKDRNGRNYILLVSTLKSETHMYRITWLETNVIFASVSDGNFMSLLEFYKLSNGVVY